MGATPLKAQASPHALFAVRVPLNAGNCGVCADTPGLFGEMGDVCMYTLR